MYEKKQAILDLRRIACFFALFIIIFITYL